ncbi:hypothetical protein [Taklimakanibacter deserti]|uniref:hypothetical protein n=1 Tax=Taklimakanibacter deserti TaxID=2267839 RepID=UPI000E64B316
MVALPSRQSAWRRSGWLPTPFNRCILVSVPDRLDYARLEPLLASMRRERLSFLFIPGNSAARRDLIEQFGEAAIVDPPWNNRLSSLIFLLTSRVRLVIGIDGLNPLPHSLVKEAYKLGIGIAVTAASLQEIGADTLNFVDLWLPHAVAVAQALRARGISRDKIIEALPIPVPHPLAIERLNFLMGRRPPARSLLQTLIAERLDSPIGRTALGMRARRVETLAELNERLGHPQTILCLGNGPSCEDPALARHEFDCLFRVNHRWLERGRHCRPQMVFTGQKRTLFTVRSKPIFAFQTRLAEAHLVTHQIFNPLCRPMRFVTLERLGVLGELDCDGVRPTNGATMLATAVALNPARLIIAGIDLFADPAGAYPGDDKTENDYVVAHERSIEIAFILKTLQSYGGELIILGGPLATKWAAMRREPSAN